MSNRVIKFRAIHPPTNELREIAEFILDDNHGSQEIRFSCDKIWYSAKGVEQFTGLQDKIGTDIYIGDKVEHWMSKYKQDNPMIIKTVEQLYIGIEESDEYYRLEPNTFEIIGNIHDKETIK